MYHLKVTTLIACLCMASIVLAQQHEFAFTLTGINNLQPVTKDSDAIPGASSFWAPFYNYGFSYRKSFSDKRLLLYAALEAIGFATDIKYVSYPNPDCPGCRRISKTSTGGHDAGLLLGIGQRYTFKQKQLDLIGGSMLRRIYDKGVGSSGKRCDELSCFVANAIETYDLSGSIHANLFLKASWKFFLTKDQNFHCRLHFIYNQGLQKLYHTISTLTILTSDQTYHRKIQNKGSYFGIGVALGWRNS